MENSLKIRTFKATIEPILANAGQSTPQCVSKFMVDVMPGYLKWPQIYHGNIRSPIYNYTWEMPKITEVIKLRRLRLAGHCIRHTDEIAHNLVLWKQKNGIRNRGRQPNTYIDILQSDCNCEEDELRTLMMDRE